VRLQKTSSSSSQTHELKQRRSGSQFWNASKRCETMLQFSGLPVVRAEAEGEALCALSNGILETSFRMTEIVYYLELKHYSIDSF